MNNCIINTTTTISKSIGYKLYIIFVGVLTYAVSNLIFPSISRLAADPEKKHEFAAMLQLRETLDMVEKYYRDEFQKTGSFAAVAKGTLLAFVVDKKETGGFVL